MTTRLHSVPGRTKKLPPLRVGVGGPGGSGLLHELPHECWWTELMRTRGGKLVGGRGARGVESDRAEVYRQMERVGERENDTSTVESMNIR